MRKAFAVKFPIKDSTTAVGDEEEEVEDETLGNCQSHKNIYTAPQEYGVQGKVNYLLAFPRSCEKAFLFVVIFFFLVFFAIKAIDFVHGSTRHLCS